MVIYHSNGVIRKLVKYIEKYYPEALLLIRPKDTLRNRERGYRSGQPDILISEQKCRYMGLAVWVTSEMSKSKKRFRRRLGGKAYEIIIVSDDFDNLRLCFDMYMAKCDDSCKVDYHQLRLIRESNRDKVIRKYSPRTSSYDFALRFVVKHVRDKYPSAVIIPGLGVDGQPDLMIISPNIIHNGIAVWVSHTDYCYSFPKMSDNQLGFLKRMALRSYVTIASKRMDDLNMIIDKYMGDEYEYGHNLPTDTEEFYL